MRTFWPVKVKKQSTVYVWCFLVAGTNMAEGNIELTRVGSLCTPDPQTQLLNAWKSKDLDSFCKLLKQPDVSADHWYGEPVHATLLYLACKDDAVKYVQALLNAKAQPNNLNQIRNKAPIHIAAERAEHEVLEALLEDERTDVNILDNFGDTPLHIIAKQKLKSQSEDTVSKYIYCIQLLMCHKGIKVNVCNKKGYTAVHYAALNSTEQAVQTILKCAGDDIDIDTYKAGLKEKSARETILENFPELAELLPEEGRPGNKKETVDSSTLFKYLYERDFDSFIIGISVVSREELGKNDGSSTLLQYCAKEGLESPARALLDQDVDPNATCPADLRSPAFLACYSGQPGILNLLFQKHGPHSVDLIDGLDARETALHAVLKSPRADTSVFRTDYRGCLGLLLKNLPRLQIDINAADHKGNTALHYAAQNDDSDAVLSLLKHGAYIGIRNVLGEPPLANMSPKMLETFLDGCLDTNGEFPREDTYEVTFSYKFLVPPPRESCMQQEQQQQPSVQVALSLNDCDSPREPLAHQNISTARINTETEPLLYISQSRDLRYLLKHPIFTSFLDLKWHRIRIFFLFNLIFYILFVAVLTLYILLWYSRPHIVDSYKNSDNTSIISSGETEESATETVAVFKHNASGFWWAVLIVFLALLTVRELFQLVVFSSKYFKNPENYLEFLLLITSAAILFSDWVHGHARPHFSAVAILLSWAELVLLIGRHPSLSVNIEMFKRVSWNFLKFLAWYAILIVAFALSFYALFRGCDGATECGEAGDSNENFFLHPGMSVFKTVVMLTGEFDVASIPFVSFPVTSHIVFILFIFLIAIVLFNLLNGLAVSDTQAIRDDAEIVSYMSRVKLMSHIETLFQSPSLIFVGTLRRICCCLPTVSLKPIASRIYLFPYKVPDNVIRVLPNRGSRIMFCIHQKKRQEIEEETTQCCPHGCGSSTLDPEILKKAMEIINNRHKVSDLDEVKIKLKELEFRFDRMEKSLKETKVMLERILDILHKSDSSNRK